MTKKQLVSSIWQDRKDKIKYIQNLERICEQAIQDGNINGALKAEKLIGDAAGYFQKPTKRSKLNVQEMSDEDVEDLIHQLKDNQQP